MKFNDPNTRTESGNDWQSYADKSVITDTEGTGKTSHKRPEKSEDTSQEAPNGIGTWPYSK